MRFINATSDESMQKLAGDNVNRFLKLRDSLVFSGRHCVFDNGGSGGGRRKNKKGLFFTNPYFTRLEDGDGAFKLRQYISPKLGDVELRRGLLLPKGPWSEAMAYVPEGTNRVDGRRLENIENAVRSSVN